MAKKPSFEDRLYSLVSGAYLTNDIPFKIIGKYDDVCRFITKNAWEPLERYEEIDVFLWIDNSYQALVQFLEKTKKDAKFEDRLFSHVSGMFLTKCVPLNFNDQSEEKQYNFIRRNAWEPLENESEVDVIECIQNTYDVISQFLQEESK